MDKNGKTNPGKRSRPSGKRSRPSDTFRLPIPGCEDDEGKSQECDSNPTPPPKKNLLSLECLRSHTCDSSDDDYDPNLVSMPEEIPVVSGPCTQFYEEILARPKDDDKKDDDSQFYEKLLAGPKDDNNDDDTKNVTKGNKLCRRKNKEPQPGPSGLCRGSKGKMPTQAQLDRMNEEEESQKFEPVYINVVPTKSSKSSGTYSGKKGKGKGKTSPPEDDSAGTGTASDPLRIEDVFNTQEEVETQNEFELPDSSSDEEEDCTAPGPPTSSLSLENYVPGTSEYPPLTWPGMEYVLAYENLAESWHILDVNNLLSLPQYLRADTQLTNEERLRSHPCYNIAKDQTMYLMFFCRIEPRKSNNTAVMLVRVGPVCHARK